MAPTGTNPGAETQFERCSDNEAGRGADDRAVRGTTAHIEPYPALLVGIRVGDWSNFSCGRYNGLGRRCIVISLAKLVDAAAQQV